MLPSPVSAYVATAMPKSTPNKPKPSTPIPVDGQGKKKKKK